jgi:NitT/TauT family transport system substrate-binding protein
MLLPWWCGPAAAQARLSLMVGGADKQIYLPVVVARELGYFEAEGLEVELLSERAGVHAEDQLLAGAVQGVVGFYDHTVDLQAKGTLVTSVVQLGRIPGEALLVAARHAAEVRTVADLKGRPVGVTGLGSSTHFLTRYPLARAGLRPGEFRAQAVGAGDSLIEALNGGRIVAGMTTEPTVSRLLQTGQASVLVDLRTLAGTEAALGGPYPAACIYMRESWVNAHRPQVRQLAAALVKALRYIQTHGADELAALVPPAYYAGDRDLYVKALAAGKDMFTPDGRMPPGGPETVLKVLQAVDPRLHGKSIDLRRTYTHEFVDAHPAR